MSSWSVGWAVVTLLLAANLDAGQKSEPGKLTNTIDPDGTTALHRAVQRNDFDAVDKLIRAGADVKAANRYGVTPLQSAATNGSARDDRKAAGRRRRPQHRVARRRDRADDGSPHRRRGSGQSSGRTRREGERDGRLEKADRTDVGRSREQRGRCQGSDRRGRRHHRRGRRAGRSRHFCLPFAADTSARQRLLLDAGADVNQPMPDGTSPLLLAIINAHYELAGFLLDRGADPNADGQGWTALHQVVWSRRPNTGMQPSRTPCRPGVSTASIWCRKLLQHGANVNARQKKEPKDGYRNMLNRIGATPFLLAAKSVDLPLMRLLLEHGADPTLTTEDGTTALMAAAGVGIWAPGENPGTEEEALAAVKLSSRSAGRLATDVDKNGETALHGAIYRAGSIAMAQVPDREGREARRQERQRVDAADRRRRRRIHAQRAQALSGDGGIHPWGHERTRDAGS